MEKNRARRIICELEDSVWAIARQKVEGAENIDCRSYAEDLFRDKVLLRSLIVDKVWSEESTGAKRIKLINELIRASAIDTFQEILRSLKKEILEELRSSKFKIIAERSRETTKK